MSQTDDSISEDDYARWLPPNEAVVSLMEKGWTRELAIAALTTRLSASLILAAAQHVIWKPRTGPTERGDYRLVPSSHWNPDSAWLPDASIWETGDIFFDLMGSGYDITLQGRISYFGVRFDPAWISPMASSAAAVDAQDANEKKPPNPLSEALLSKWADLFNEAYPKGSEALASRSVAGMFPDKLVTRDRLRRVLPERPQGRPKKNSDLDK